MIGAWLIIQMAQLLRSLFGVDGFGRRSPKVARSSQPWALLQNPFGIRPEAAGLFGSRNVSVWTFGFVITVVSKPSLDWPGNPEGIELSSPRLRARKLPWDPSRPTPGCACRAEFAAVLKAHLLAMFSSLLSIDPRPRLNPGALGTGTLRWQYANAPPQNGQFLI